MMFVEGRRLVVDRINDHQSAACLLRTLHDQLRNMSDEPDAKQATAKKRAEKETATRSSPNRQARSVRID
jgi:hypothetical protein